MIMKKALFTLLIMSSTLAVPIDVISLDDEVDCCINRVPESRKSHNVSRRLDQTA